MRAIGRDPVFIERGHGAEIVDVDGNHYVDYVCSWGPLIHGHAHPAILAAILAAAERGTTFGAPTQGEVDLADEIARADAVRRDGAHDLLGDRGHDERASAWPAPRPGARRSSSSPAPTTAMSTGSSRRRARAWPPRRSRPAPG